MTAQITGQYNEPMTTDGHLTDELTAPLEEDRAARRAEIDAALQSILTKDAALLERLADA